MVDVCGKLWIKYMEKALIHRVFHIFHRMWKTYMWKILRKKNKRFVKMSKNRYLTENILTIK